MSFRTVLACVAVLATVALNSRVAAAPQLQPALDPPTASNQQQEPQSMVVDFPPTPPTLKSLLQTVDLVVFGRVASTSPARAERSGERVAVRRLQEVDVLEVLKGDIEKRVNKIQVRQIGGTVLSEGREYSVAYPVKLVEPGDVVLLFLRRVGNSGAVFDIAYGSDGIVWSKSADQRMVLPAGLRKMPELSSLASSPASAILDALRRTAKNR